MNFSTETITEAIDRAYNSPMFHGISQKGLTSLILSFCGEIEGDKIRAEYDRRYGQTPESEEFDLAA